MVSILNERQISDDEMEKIEAERVHSPTIVDPEFDFMVARKQANQQQYKNQKYKVLTREEVRRLMEASEEPVSEIRESYLDHRTYPTLSRDEASRLVREHFEYIEEEERRKKIWDSLRTTE